MIPFGLLPDTSKLKDAAVDVSCHLNAAVGLPGHHRHGNEGTNMAQVLVYTTLLTHTWHLTHPAFK